jgi:phosphatidylserine decarboxylase
LNFRQKYYHIPFAREGLLYLLYAAFATFLMAVLGQLLLTWLFFAVTMLIGHFFRDPERVITATDRDVVAPADGKVIALERCEEPCFTHDTCWKISIFMSVFDVHVNRVPCSGVVIDLRYQAGQFFAANRLEASRKNEQNWLYLKNRAGHAVILTQVAGLIARRIVCWPKPGDEVVCGERFGMIRFGSRVDVYVPEQSRVQVSIGDRVVAGGSVLCQLI